MPFATSIQPTYMQAWAQNVVTLGIKGQGVVPGTLVVGLYTARSVPISPNMTFADLTEASFTGYAQVTVVLGPLPIVNLPSGQGVGVQIDADFNLSAAPGQNIQGYFVLNQAAGALEVVEDFGAPISLANGGDFLSLDLVLGEPYSVRMV